MGVPTHFVKLISNLYDNQQACVRTEKGDSDWFNIGQGVRQGQGVRHLSDQGTFTPVGAQGGGGVPRDPTVENRFPTGILQ